MYEGVEDEPVDEYIQNTMHSDCQWSRALVSYGAWPAMEVTWKLMLKMAQRHLEPCLVKLCPLMQISCMNLTGFFVL